MAGSSDRVVPSAAPPKAPEKTAATPAPQKTETARLLRERLDRAQAAAEEESFPWMSGVIAVAVLAGGAGFFLWRRRGREAGKAVPAARDAAPAALGGLGGARERAAFTVELLSKIEWKCFQDLVEAYYSKTGVVALRTRAGPQSPVHIKISWKGEAQPFACVRCVSQVRGAVEPPLLEELLAVLESEKIRRGYVVATGRFSSAARELAERRQLTLMSGEALVEKLNALPESVRAEIMQITTAADATIPSCPVCEAKMSLSREHPPVWRCASHPDKSFPAEG